MTTRAAAYALYKDDYLYHDGVEDVTLTKFADGAVVASVKAKNELPGTPAIRQFGSDVADRCNETDWVLWDTSLGGYSPQEGDAITTSGGTVWRILSTSRELWDTQWHVHCMEDR